MKQGKNHNFIHLTTIDFLPYGICWDSNDELSGHEMSFWEPSLMCSWVLFNTSYSQHLLCQAAYRDPSFTKSPEHPYMEENASVLFCKLKCKKLSNLPRLTVLNEAQILHRI